MYQGKLAVAAAVAILLTGCSQKSETTTAGDHLSAEAIQSNTNAASAQSPVEISASTKPVRVDDHRPIELPETLYQSASTSQTFEIGNDAPLEETRSTRAVNYQFSPVNISHSARFAPTYPDRPVPQRGMEKEEVLAAVGTPANQMTGNGSEIWDYGTYRVFFSKDVVAFTRVW